VLVTLGINADSANQHQFPLDMQPVDLDDQQAKAA
jgi:hypothetical protein